MNFIYDLYEEIPLHPNINYEDLVCEDNNQNGVCDNCIDENKDAICDKYYFLLDEKELPKYLEENLPKLFNEGKNNIKFEEKKKVNIIKKLINNSPVFV